MYADTWFPFLPLNNIKLKENFSKLLHLNFNWIYIHVPNGKKSFGRIPLNDIMEIIENFIGSDILWIKRHSNKGFPKYNFLMLRKTFHFALKRRIGLILIMYRPCKKDNYASHYRHSLEWPQSVLRLQSEKNWLEAIAISKLSSLSCLQLHLGSLAPGPPEIKIVISTGS